MNQLVQHQQTINDQLARYGVKFGLYKSGNHLSDQRCCFLCVEKTADNRACDCL